jgi:hypothetical protein
MPDAFATFVPGLTAPAIRSESITPSDGGELAAVTRALFVGQSGDVRAQLISGPVVTFMNMQAGSVYPLRIRQVLATGTTAGGLVGLS